MPLYEAIGWISRTVFILIFARTLIEAIRRPRRENIYVALLFGSITLAIVLTVASRFLGGAVPGISIGTAVVAVALPLMLLQIVTSFAVVPRAARWTIWAGFIPSLVLVAILRPPYHPAFTLWIIGYFVLATTYSTVQFARRLGTARGARRRRKQAVAVGSAMLAMSILLSASTGFVPAGEAVLRTLAALAGLLCATAYLLGFAPPHWVRRAWQGPEIERFLSVLASAATAPLARVTQALEGAVSGAIGSERALISLWSEEDERLRAPSFAPPVQPPARSISSAAFDVFVTQQPRFVDDMLRLHPENAEVYRNLGMLRAMLAPITSGDRRRLGVLTVYGFDAPLFPDEDLVSLTMMANQIAIVLAARQSAEQAAQAEASVAMVKLHEEFLAAASHDLRTPLTTILGQAELLQRRLRRVVPPPPELENVDILVGQALRMRSLTEDIMSVMQDSGGFVRDRVPTDLRAIIDEVVTSTYVGGREMHVEGLSAVAPVDAPRVAQVITNLIDNALKFSDGAIDIGLVDRKDEVELKVRDHGVGIAPGELTRIFNRFTRGTSAVATVDGVGLGLFICNRIVEGHGGRIWAVSTVGEGSTFHAVFPKQVE